MLFSLIEELTSHRVGFRNLCKFINPPSPGWVWRPLYRIYVVWEAQESRAKTSAPGSGCGGPHTWHDAVHTLVSVTQVDLQHATPVLRMTVPPPGEAEHLLRKPTPWAGARGAEHLTSCTHGELR